MPEVKKKQCLFVNFFCIVFVGSQQEDLASNPGYEEVSTPEGYLVHTSQCQIPDLDIWDISVSPYVKRNVSSLRCDKTTSKPDLTFVKVSCVQDCQLPDFSLRSQTFCYTADFLLLFLYMLKTKTFLHISS